VGRCYETECSGDVSREDGGAARRCRRVSFIVLLESFVNWRSGVID